MLSEYEAKIGKEITMIEALTALEKGELVFINNLLYKWDGDLKFFNGGWIHSNSAFNSLFTAKFHQAIKKEKTRGKQIKAWEAIKILSEGGEVFSNGFLYKYIDGELHYGEGDDPRGYKISLSVTVDFIKRSFYEVVQ